MAANVQAIVVEHRPAVGSFARGRIVVMDENEQTRTFVCAALDSAGFEPVPVATTIGLRRALEPERPAIVVCDVSPPLSYRQILDSVRAVNGVADGRAPVILCGSQPSEQLSILVHASGAAGFLERREDPMVLLRQLRRFVASWRRPPSDEPTTAIRSGLQWAIIKLLLVDDSEITLELMQARLRRAGFDVRLALSLGEVHSIIQGWSPNVIVADVNMPDMRGDDLCARLKAAASTRDATVILCSSTPEDQLEALARASGADGYVSKRLGLDHFVSRIEGACRRISNPVVSFG